MRRGEAATLCLYQYYLILVVVRGWGGLASPSTLSTKVRVPLADGATADGATDAPVAHYSNYWFNEAPSSEAKMSKGWRGGIHSSPKLTRYGFSTTLWLLLFALLRRGESADLTIVSTYLLFISSKCHSVCGHLVALSLSWVGPKIWHPCITACVCRLNVCVVKSYEILSPRDNNLKAIPSSVRKRLQWKKLR
jgi:hypothetical protein